MFDSGRSMSPPPPFFFLKNVKYRKFSFWGAVNLGLIIHSPKHCLLPFSFFSTICPLASQSSPILPIRQKSLATVTAEGLLPVMVVKQTFHLNISLCRNISAWFHQSVCTVSCI